MVSLQSLDEDRLGEELDVLWELELGHTITPPQGLPETINPDGFDDPETLSGFIDAMRWGAVTSADDQRIQAPFWSGVSVEAYQLEPLRRALESPRTNLLLADDVGLGKTIEAGLVVQELFLRHRARTAIIVCPPSLSIEVARRNARQVWSRIHHRQHRALGTSTPHSRPACQPIPAVSPHHREHGVAAPSASATDAARRVSAKLVILSPPNAMRSTSSSWTKLTTSRHRVRRPLEVGGAMPWTLSAPRQCAALAEQAASTDSFLSATPHNGHSESFTALMEMIDPRRFSRGAKLDPDALNDVTVRRLKSQLSRSRGSRSAS